jgi:large subunit ribosomal protein L30
MSNVPPEAAGAAEAQTRGKRVAAASTEASRNAGKRAGRQSDKNGAYFLVRLRGTVHITGKIRDTLEMLRLNRPMHAVVIPKTESYVGMVNKVKDYVAFGDIDTPTLAALIRGRGRLMGDKPITDASIKEATQGKYATIDAFAKAVADGKASMKDLGEDAKPVFRLHPPEGGFPGSTKKHYTVKGELGYRGKEINQLVMRMI